MLHNSSKLVGLTGTYECCGGHRNEAENRTSGLQPNSTFNGALRCNYDGYVTLRYVRNSYGCFCRASE
eukprot:6921450-Prymnesium_polylepis.1